MTGGHGYGRVISADEIGIETARHGGLVMRSAFQLVFSTAEEGMLRAVAAESFLRPFRDGIPVPPRPLLEGLAADERAFVAGLGMTLHLRNHRHLDLDGLDHILATCPTSASSEDTEQADAARLVCSIRKPCLAEDGLPPLARELRARGARVAVGGPSLDPPPLDTIRRVRPDIVRIGGGWFRRVCESEGALRLLARLVEGFRVDGALVLVEGIETKRQLAAALDAGADLVQGFLLARPELAGTAIETPVLDLAAIFAGEAKVIPLFGGACG